MSIKCKTVLIATDGKAPITHNDIEEGLFSNPMSILAKHRMGKCTNMHLYVTNDEKPKIGDWCVEFMLGNPLGVIKVTAEDSERCLLNYTCGSCRKIIATTNRELKVFFNERTIHCIYKDETEIGHRSLPDISTPVINKCIAEYNIGNKSIELDVEGEFIVTNEDWSKRPVELDGYVKFKLDPKDNTILIKNFKAPKENFTAKEVKFIATRFAHACRLKEVVTNKETCELFDKWFKEINKSL